MGVDPEQRSAETGDAYRSLDNIHRKNVLGDGSPHEQYIFPNLDKPPSAHQLEPYQLPSPEVSPSSSPRSSSPYPGMTDSSSAEFDTFQNSQNGYVESESFKYVADTRNEDIAEATLRSRKPVSKNLPPLNLFDTAEVPRKIRKMSLNSFKSPPDERVLKLSPLEIKELTGAPESLPTFPITRAYVSESGLSSPSPVFQTPSKHPKGGMAPFSDGKILLPAVPSKFNRFGFTTRAISTPVTNRLDPFSPHAGPDHVPTACTTSHIQSDSPRVDGEMRRLNLRLEAPESDPSDRSQPPGSTLRTPPTPAPEKLVSPILPEIPVPPMSIPTYLQLELASSRPSPLYIYRSPSSEYPYESSKVKFERLLNFLLLPPQLEQVLGFGALACLDAWLYTFTILPLRFIKAAAILVHFWCTVLASEAHYIAGFIYYGSGRMWHRQRGRSESTENTPVSRSASRSRPPITADASYHTLRSPNGNASNSTDAMRTELEKRLKSNSKWGPKHYRKKSQPSALSPYHKADLLQGSVIICSCMILMCFDASRMYHSIRGQSAIKLYMVWSVLEVGDRLLGALGQDIFECLFSEETIERGPDGRSKLLRPFGMFLLALIYNLIHAAALFYQVITLNVAINSYSNALLSLLMSNMFVEIKSTVFKRFEKDNIFQLTCADIVERFQLILMLVIIGLRNVVEVGGISVSSTQVAGEAIRNSTVPLRSNSILPNSFTILPNWTGEVLSPFLLVIGSEMIVDWLKHAYISKFNNVKPAVYQRYLDVLAKDYYTDAFVNQNLTRRIGLPVIPLSCLFIRASVQTYYMFLATHLPPPIRSTATELALDTEPTASPVVKAALEHFDTIIRRALGRSTFGTGVDTVPQSWYMFGTDDLIALLTMLIFFLCAFLILLACKLILGMLLLNYARNRYSSMKKREHMSLDTKGKIMGDWGLAEVDDEKMKWIYEGDPNGVNVLKERERKEAAKAKALEKGVDFSKVTRYEMVAKRIW